MLLQGRQESLVVSISSVLRLKLDWAKQMINARASNTNKPRYSQQICNNTEEALGCAKLTRRSRHVWCSHTRGAPHQVRVRGNAPNERTLPGRRENSTRSRFEIRPYVAPGNDSYNSRLVFARGLVAPARRANAKVRTGRWWRLSVWRPNRATVSSHQEPTYGRLANHAC